MVDRTDIDALLIGALYGELAPADEARLTAHLESHPADRTALADLTQTRARFRDSRLFATQFDPPQSVTALLLQEAARRAPARDGWFQRLVRSLTAHPAMAAAMTLVIVVGVAGSLYMRHEDGFDAAPAPEMVRSADSLAQAPAAASVPTAGAGSAAYGAGLASADPSSEGGAMVAGKANKGGVVAAADNNNANDAKEASAIGGATGALESGRFAKDHAAPAAHQSMDQLAMAPPPPPAAAPSAPSVAATTSAPSPAKRVSRGIEVRGATELMPKDLPADERRKLAVDRDGAFAKNEPAPSADTAPAAPPPEVTAQAGPSSGSISDANKLRVREASPAPAQAQTVAPDDRTIVGWAQKQREQVIAYVRANNCRAAASTANEIYNRAPDYYASNIEVDRSIKPCLAYLNSERERTDRAKAAKRSEPADPAPPSRK